MALESYWPFSKLTPPKSVIVISIIACLIVALFFIGLGVRFSTPPWYFLMVVFVMFLVALLIWISYLSLTRIKDSDT